MKIKIEKLVYEGWGLGCSKDGKVVLVKKSVPGDEVEAYITKDKKNYANGIIKEIINPSPIRIKPRCQFFDKCGGCEHQNIPYDVQLRFKGKIFTEILKKQRIDTKSEKIIPGSNHPFFYRNSIRFFFIDKPDGDIGFARQNFDYKKGLVEVDKCFLQSVTANEILPKLKQYINENVENKGSFWQLKIREGKATGDFMVEIITSTETLPDKEGIANCIKEITGVKSIYHTVAPAKSLTNMKRYLLFGSPVIYEKIGSLLFQISPESFFQTNSLGVKTLYNKIKEYAAVTPKDVVLDLYCGTGSIAIYLSPMAKNVTGVEIIPEAVRDAKDNAMINHIHNVEFIREDSEKYLNNNLTIKQPASPVGGFNNSVIVIDPPRAGLRPETIESISKIDFDRLIYVSCNPATFARDIVLFEKRGIGLKKVQPIDMFPQTHHIECVGLLKRNGTG
ncbi:MAG: 23S rRNA (uracil(1939)-C(5))-methyltransferase RlmD [Patescibacteria group bacterium]